MKNRSFFHAALPRRRVLCGLLASLALCATGVQAQETTRVRFTLDWRIDGPGAIVLLAQAKGYFAQEQLDVVIDAGSGSAAAVQRLVAGTHDIGFADTSALVEYRSTHPQGTPIQAVYMLLDQAPAAVFALKSSGIETPADLKGRTLGAPVFDAGRKTWPLFASANGLAPNDVTWTNVDPALRETLLVRGDLDAITGFYYTSVLNLQARGVNEADLTVFRYADHGVALYGNAVVVSPDFAAAHPQAVSAFLRALTRGIQDTLADPQAAIAYVKAREPMLDAQVEEQRLRYFLDHFLATPAVRRHGLGAVDAQRLNANIAQIMQAFGLTQPVDAAQLFNSDFLPPADARQL